MSDFKVVIKFLRYLLEKLQLKVITIKKKEGKNIYTLKLDELVGILQTYETNHHIKRSLRVLR